jgi:hypothetical protein
MHGAIQDVKYGVEDLRWYSTHLNEQNSHSTYVQKAVPVDIWSMLVWYLQQMLYVIPKHFNTTFSSSLYRDAQSIENLFCHSNLLTVIPYSLLYYLEVTDWRWTHQSGYMFPKPNFRRLRPGDRAGQLTGPPCLSHCSPKMWFRCCLTIRRKWIGAPSCMNSMCCRWWRAHVPCVLVNHSWKMMVLVSLLGKTIGPKLISNYAHTDFDGKSMLIFWFHGWCGNFHQPKHGYYETSQYRFLRTQPHRLGHLFQCTSYHVEQNNIAACRPVASDRRLEETA